MVLTTDILLLFIEGDLDCCAVPSLHQRVRDAIDKGCRRVILNLSATRYVDSAGVAFVFSVARHLRNVDGLLSLYGVREEVYYVFRLARLVDFIPISFLGRRRHVSALEPHVHPLSCRTLAVKPGCLAETRERVRFLLNETTLYPLLNQMKFTTMCDIDNPLCGPQGASAVFAPQKGATPDDVAVLDAGLAHLAQVIKTDLNVDVLNLSGAGAAGGMGAGMTAFFGSSLHKGIQAVLDVANFDQRAAQADLAFSGEGSFDSQSLQGR